MLTLLGNTNSKLLVDIQESIARAAEAQADIFSTPDGDVLRLVRTAQIDIAKVAGLLRSATIHEGLNAEGTQHDLA